jgi:hypothetical protein
MLTLKTSIGLFFLRILIARWQRRIVYVAIGLSAIFNFGYFFFICFQCGISNSSFEIWQKFVSSRCATTQQILGVAYAHAGVTALTDWTFAILPLTVIKQSQLGTREKFIVGFIISMGAM